MTEDYPLLSHGISKVCFIYNDWVKGNDNNENMYSKSRLWCQNLSDLVVKRNKDAT